MPATKDKKPGPLRRLVEAVTPGKSDERDTPVVEPDVHNAPAAELLRDVDQAGGVEGLRLAMSDPDSMGVPEQPSTKRMTATSRAAAKPASAKKTATKRVAAKKTTATKKKAPAKKAPAAQKKAAKKAPAAKKTAAKKTLAKKTASKKTAAKRAPAKKTPAKRTAKR